MNSFFLEIFITLLFFRNIETQFNLEQCFPLTSKTRDLIYIVGHQLLLLLDPILITNWLRHLNARKVIRLFCRFFLGEKKFFFLVDFRYLAILSNFLFVKIWPSRVIMSNMKFDLRLKCHRIDEKFGSANLHGISIWWNRDEHGIVWRFSNSSITSHKKFLKLFKFTTKSISFHYLLFGFNFQLFFVVVGIIIAWL